MAPGFQKFLKITFRLILGISLCIALAWGALAWRLSQSPVSLDFLRPRIIAQVKKTFPKQTLSLGSIALEWDKNESRHRSPFDIHVHQLNLVDDQGAPFVSADHMIVRLSFWKLLVGSLTPREVRILKPRLHTTLTTDQTGGTDFPVLEDLRDHNGKAIAAAFFQGIALFIQRTQAPKIRILEGSAHLNHPDGSTWTLNHVDFVSKRFGQQKASLRFQAQHTTPTTQGPLHTVALSLVEKGRLVHLTLDHGNISLDHLRDHYPWAPQGPLRGDIATHLEVALEKNHGLRSGVATFKTSRLEWLLDNGGAGNVIGKNVVLRLESLKGMQDVKLVPTQLDTNLGMLSLEGHLGKTIDFDMESAQIDAAQILKLWPQSWHGSLRDHIRSYVKSGFLKDARFSFSLDKKTEQPTFSLQGDLDQVVMPSVLDLPEVTHITGNLDLDETQCTLSFTHGRVLKTTHLTGGQLTLSDLDQSASHLDLDLFLEGPLENAARAAEFYLEKAGIRLQKNKGNAATAVHVDGPLSKETHRKDMAVTVTTAVSDGAFFLDRLDEKGRVSGTTEIQKADFQLRQSPQALDIQGTFATPFLEGTLTIKRAHDPAAAEQLRVAAKGFLGHGVLKEGGMARTLNMTQKAPFTLEGVALKNQVGRFEFQADLTPAALEIPTMGWKKKTGQQGNIHFIAIFKDGKLTQVQDLKVQAPHLDIVGTGTFDPLNLNLTRFRLGDNDLKVRLKDLGADGWRADLRGAVLDLQSMDKDGTSKLDVTLDLDQVFLPDGKQLGKTVGTYIARHGHVHQIKLELSLPNSTSSSIRLTPLGDHQDLEIVTRDLGKLMDVTGVFQGMHGGVATIHATRPLGKGGVPTGEGFTGTVEAKGFRLSKTPSLTKLLTLTSISGVIDTLRGKEILFDEGQADVTVSPQEVRISKGRISGAGLSITFKGVVDRENNQINLKGHVIPLYALNSIVGKIPVIGHIIAGTKQDGGLLAVAYSVTGDTNSPNVSANPLSALTPGIIQDIFKGEDE